MTFICLICKEAVTSESDYQITSLNENESKENIILATKCGHLYHKACLKQFFTVLEKDDQENGRKKSPTLCPKCKCYVVLQNTIRIYPEDNEDAYYTLLKEKNDIYRENVQLKAQNEHLCNELKLLNETLRNNTTESQPNSKPFRCTLKEEDRIVTFRENTNESVEGTVQSIGYYNYNSLHANILFEDGDTNLVPVAGLILRKDFYGEEETAESENIDIIIANGIAPKASDEDAANPQAQFERSIRRFKSQFKKTKSELTRLREEVDLFASEQIDGVTFFIESQKVKAASLKRQLIALGSSIQKLITTQRDLADIKETKGSQEIANVEIAECNQLEVEKRKALEILGDSLKLYNTALTQLQKIKPFIKAGFIWLETLEANVKENLETTEFSEHLPDKNRPDSIEKEMQSRRYKIATIKQAVKKFTDIPNSKLALIDHNLLNGIFFRFKAIDEEFEAWKASSNYMNVKAVKNS